MMKKMTEDCGDGKEQVPRTMAEVELAGLVLWGRLGKKGNCCLYNTGETRSVIYQERTGKWSG